MQSTQQPKPCRAAFFEERKRKQKGCLPPGDAIGFEETSGKRGGNGDMINTTWHLYNAFGCSCNNLAGRVSSIITTWEQRGRLNLRGLLKDN